jgi:putative ABC transport system permease protein
MNWLKQLFARRGLYGDLSAEIEEHLAEKIDELVAGGMSREEATFAARREFGNVLQIEERSREVWQWPALENFFMDFRYGLRQLRKNPGFTAVAVLTLALGIGANTAIFTVIDAVLLKPLPYPDPGRVVWVAEFMPQFSHSAVLVPEFAAWGRVKNVFDELGAFQVTRGVNLTGGAQPERIPAGYVAPSFFPVLGIQPMLGRVFLPDEGRPGRDHIAVISYDLWQGYFNSAPNVLGRSLVLDGQTYGVIGVMPREFLHPGSSGEALWLPIAISPAVTHPASSMGFVDVIGRLKPGISITQAQAALEVATRQMDHQYPPPWSRYHAAAHVSVTSLHNWLTRDVRPALYVMLGAVGLVLLIACANVANLLLARAVSREREMAVRAAIGAGRARLIRQMLTESTLLAFGGGGLGLLLVPLLSTILQFYVPASAAAHPHIDLRVLAMTLGCCVLSGVIFGLAPALTASKLRLTESLKENARGFGESKAHRGLRSGMVAVQLGLSVVLLVGAGLLVRSFLLLLRVNSGIDPHNVLTAQVLLPANCDLPQQREFYRRVLERVQTLPGVKFAAATTETPFTMFNAFGIGLTPEGEPETKVRYCPGIVTPDYFRAMGIRLLAGRFFDGRDAEGTLPVVILGKSLARALFPGQDAVGQRVLDDGVWRTVIGVVEDTRHLGLSEQVTPELYTSYLQQPAGYMDVVVRTVSDPLSYVPALRNAVLAVDKNQPLWDVKTMDQRVSESLSTRRERLLLLGAFAILAVLIAASGVYGVTAYSVTKRTHEIGVRVAMGARRGDIMRMMMVQGLRIILLGIAGGLAGALALSRTLANFLYHTAPTDPLTFIAVALLLFGVALLAVYIPARRATKVDPMVALRYE